MIRPGSIRINIEIKIRKNYKRLCIYHIFNRTLVFSKYKVVKLCSNLKQDLFNNEICKRLILVLVIQLLHHTKFNYSFI